MHIFGLNISYSLTPPLTLSITSASEYFIHYELGKDDQYTCILDASTHQQIVLVLTGCVVPTVRTKRQLGIEKVQYDFALIKFYTHRDIIYGL